ncbi:MAG: hypothetical protein ABEN55_18895, partial [Bradymonadaceae bacterium]
MSEESRSQFRFKCDGVEVEITGSWEFVEQMYRQIMRDIDRARPPKDSIQNNDPSASQRNRLVWVISFSDMMRRVYMTEPGEIRNSLLGRALDPDKIGTLHIDKESLSELLPRVADREETL